MNALLHRPSTALLSLGGGGLLTCVRLMADIDARTLAHPGWYVALACAGVFGTVLALGVGRELFAWGVTLLGASTANYTARREADAALLRAGPRVVRLAPDPAPPENAEAARALAWEVAAHRFVTAGQRHGFSIRTLADDDSAHKVISWDGWRAMRRVLVDAGVLTPKGGTRWAEGWDWGRWQEERGRLVLPYPENADPPTVELTPQQPTPQRPTTQEQQAETVEG